MRNIRSSLSLAALVVVLSSAFSLAREDATPTEQLVAVRGLVTLLENYAAVAGSAFWSNMREIDSAYDYFSKLDRTKLLMLADKFPRLYCAARTILATYKLNYASEFERYTSQFHLENYSRVIAREYKLCRELGGDQMDNYQLIGATKTHELVQTVACKGAEAQLSEQLLGQVQEEFCSRAFCIMREEQSEFEKLKQIEECTIYLANAPVSAIRQSVRFVPGQRAPNQELVKARLLAGLREANYEVNC